MNKSYIKLNLVGDKILIRKDVVVELLKKYPEETIKHIDEDELTTIVVNTLMNEYENNIV